MDFTYDFVLLIGCVYPKSVLRAIARASPEVRQEPSSKGTDSSAANAKR